MRSQPPLSVGAVSDDCELLARFVDAYIDGEFAEGERLSAETHLSGCADCRRLVQERANFKALLRAATPRLPAPESLRRRVSEMLNQVERESRSGSADSALLPLPGDMESAFPSDSAPQPAMQQVPRPSAWRRQLTRLALPVLLLVLPLAGYWQGRQANLQSVDITDLAETAIKHQRNLPVEVAGDMQAVRSWFAGKVPFAVRPPRLEPNASLRGGRLVNLGSREAAYLVYERPTSRLPPPGAYPGAAAPEGIISGVSAAAPSIAEATTPNIEKISVFVFDAQGLPFRTPSSASGPRPRVQMIGSHEVILEGTHGYSVAVFRDRGLGYVITGDLDEADLLRLIADAIPRPR